MHFGRFPLKWPRSHEGVGGTGRGCHGEGAQEAELGQSSGTAQRPASEAGVITPYGAFPPKPSCSIPTRRWTQQQFP